MADIDDIVKRLKVELTGVVVTRLVVAHPGDDDGLWAISVPGFHETVHIESSSGDCPFLIESDFDGDRQLGYSVEEVVSKVRSLFPMSERRY